MTISEAQPLPLPLAMAIVDQSVTIRGSPGLKRSQSRPQPLSDRAQQRLIRQAVIQAELEAEEREALKMTPEELKILQDSVKSVKAEFTDLDGLSWNTPAARELLEQWHAEQAVFRRAQSPEIAGDVPIRRVKAAITFPTTPLVGITTAQAIPAIQDSSSSNPMDKEEDTICLPRVVDSRRSSAASTIVPDREDARTPLPNFVASLDGKEINSARDNIADDSRPSLPKSHSAPLIASTNPFAEGIEAHKVAGPSAKALPPSRIPILRSKSLSAKPSTTAFTFNITSSASGSSSTRGGPTRRHVSLNLKMPVDSRTVLADSLVRNATTESPRRQREAATPMSPAKRSLATAGLSASPTRRVPGSPSGRASSSVRRSSDATKPNKFRIVSAPPPLTIPTVPPTSSALSTMHTSPSRVFSGPSPTSRPRRTSIHDRSAGTVGSPVRHSPIRGRAVASWDASPSRHTLWPTQAEPSSPTRLPKRLRGCDNPSPTRSPARSPIRMRTGGIPMQRT
ncbi:hypothetical protein GY45DRAFT_1326459 [Cubamyces sp. BRFM 1775]|nr:hypothetical protein GY45DRAFT_1326459 [Cubamyces sp. BRFM 1775]